MNNEQLKKLHKEKNTKAINENLYKANIKLVDMNRYLKIDIENLKQEIERLNNIINELEKWLKERLETLDIIDYDDDIFNGIELVLYKLQELKGVDKE